MTIARQEQKEHAMTDTNFFSAAQIASSVIKDPLEGKTKERPWRATITWERKQIALGKFADEKEAAKAYNKAALHYYGEFAFINEFDGEENNG